MSGPTRARIGLAVGLALALAIGGSFLLRPDTTPAPVEVHTHAPAKPRAPRPDRPSPAAEAHAEPADAPTSGADKAEMDRLTQEQLASGASLSNGLDLPPPGPADGPPPPRPEIPPITAEELHEQKLAAIEGLERAVARLEADLEAVRADGDAEQEHRLQLRVDRMRETLDSHLEALE